jgi:hypothetical protein
LVETLLVEALVDADRVLRPRLAILFGAMVTLYEALILQNVRSDHARAVDVVSFDGDTSPVRQAPEIQVAARLDTPLLDDFVVHAGDDVDVHWPLTHSR